jgi:hypothetical protein
MHYLLPEQKEIEAVSGAHLLYMQTVSLVCTSAAGASNALPCTVQVDATGTEWSSRHAMAWQPLPGRAPAALLS